MTWVGEGNAGCVSSNNAVNFLRIDAAAWPETYNICKYALVTVMYTCS